MTWGNLQWPWNIELFLTMENGTRDSCSFNQPLSLWHTWYGTVLLSERGVLCVAVAFSIPEDGWDGTGSNTFSSLQGAVLLLPLKVLGRQAVAPRVHAFHDSFALPNIFWFRGNHSTNKRVVSFDMQNGWKCSNPLRSLSGIVARSEDSGRLPNPFPCRACVGAPRLCAVLLLAQAFRSVRIYVRILSTPLCQRSDATCWIYVPGILPLSYVGWIDPLLRVMKNTRHDYDKHSTLHWVPVRAVSFVIAIRPT